MQEGDMVFYRPMRDIQEQTGEEKLSKAIAWLMKNGLNKKEVTYLKIAK
jgi:Cu-processing system ATP-binding protein